MISLKKAYKSDKHKLLPLILNGFEVNKYSKSIQRNLNTFFSQLFEIKWKGKNDYIGFYLEDENKKPIGFNGYIFSTRKIGNETYNFCNLTTWVVEKKYTRYGMLLYKPIEKLKSTHIITNFSPSIPSQFILKRMKFNILDQIKYLIPFIPSFSVFNNHKIKTQTDSIGLSADEKIIYNDHSKTKIIFLQYFNKSQSMLIGCRKVLKKKLSFLEIMYLSDKELFLNDIQILRSIINIKCRTLGLIIDSRFLSSEKIIFSFKFRTKEPKLFYGDSIELNKIDNLYSELAYIPR